VKSRSVLLIVLLSLLIVGGCTCITKVEPRSGPAGTVVFVNTENMWGEPGKTCVKWDGKTICNSFSGSFTVPAVSGPGKHRITIVDKIDPAEACLIFPLLRIRHAMATFEVVE
jgi:hypothetical protein